MNNKQSNLKKAKVINRPFTEEYIHMASEHMKIFPTSLTTGKRIKKEKKY